MPAGVKIGLAFLTGMLAIVAFTVLQGRLEASPPKKSKMPPSFKYSLCNLGSSLGSVQCAPTRSFASIIDHEAKMGPQQCDCPGNTKTFAGSWNNCISCLYVTFVGIHNGFAREFAGILNDTSEFTTNVLHDRKPLVIQAKRSSLDGFARHAQIRNASGELCMNLHQTRDEKSPEKMKAILHLDSNQCPHDGTVGSHAMAMKLDMGYSDENVQSVEFFHTGEYEGNGFDIRGNDSDDIFYMRLNIEKKNKKALTTAWVYRLNKNKGWKYYLRGEDDAVVYVANQADSGLKNAELGKAGMAIQCVDDRNDKVVDAKECNKSGFKFVKFPLSLRSIASKNYPKWTSDTLKVDAERSVQDYFQE